MRKKLLASLAVTGTLLMTTGTAFASTLSASVGTTAPSSNDGTTYTLTKNTTNMNGTYYYVSVDGTGLIALDPPSCMY